MNQTNLQYKMEMSLITKEELYAFLGILVFMGFHYFPQYVYWSEDENFQVVSVSRVVPLFKRFLKILMFLHINDNLNTPSVSSPEYDKLYKIRPLLAHLTEKYANLFSPFRFISIDASTVWQPAFKGRSTLKQYMPKKPIK